MIPKTIHYCWFGRNPKPKLAEKCIKSWRRRCPDYEIVEWNEDNYDLAAAPLYVRQAYEAKKWAFVTDYVRLDVVYRCGGIYLDTDVEVLKKLDPFLRDRVFFGVENDKHINTGLGFGAEKGAEILREMMADYQGIPFVLPDGSFDQMTCPERNTKAVLRHGFVQNGSEQLLDGGIHIYPKDYFCPRDYYSGRMKRTRITHTIHWFAASWRARKDQRADHSGHRHGRWRKQIGKLFGEKTADAVASGYHWMKTRFSR